MFENSFLFCFTVSPASQNFKDLIKSGIAKNIPRGMIQIGELQTVTGGAESLLNHQQDSEPPARNISQLG